MTLSTTAMELMDVAEELAAIMTRIYHRARFQHEVLDVATIGRLQELQRLIEKHSNDDPCVRAIAAWEAHLVDSEVALKREHYSEQVCEAYWNEAARLQSEFDKAVEASSQE